MSERAAFEAIPFDDDADEVQTWKGLALSAIMDMRRYAYDSGPERRMVSARAYEADAVRIHACAPGPMGCDELRVLCRLAWNGWTDSEQSRKIISEHEIRDTPSRDAWDRVIETLAGALQSAPAAGCPLPSGEVGPAVMLGYAGADAREMLAERLQQFWQAPSGRSWNASDDEKSCCKLLPGQADWFRRLADVALATMPAPTTAMMASAEPVAAHRLFVEGLQKYGDQPYSWKAIHAAWSEAFATAPSPDTAREDEAIPSGICFQFSEDNFVSAATGMSCGGDFYNKWRPRWREFPECQAAARPRKERGGSANG